MPRIGNLPASAVAVIVIAVAVLVWLLFIRGDDDDGSNGPAASVTKTVELVSAAELPAEVSGVGNPVYWLGAEPGVDYEVTIIGDGRTYVRYLPTGVEEESPNRYLTVGSYAQQNAFDVLKGLGERQGEGTVRVPDGGIALKNTSSGVYVAFPGADTQIEIFDPQPGRAFRLAKSGDLSPVG